MPVIQDLGGNHTAFVSRLFRAIPETVLCQPEWEDQQRLPDQALLTTSPLRLRRLGASTIGRSAQTSELLLVNGKPGSTHATRAAIIATTNAASLMMPAAAEVRQYREISRPNSSPAATLPCKKSNAGGKLSNSARLSKPTFK